MESINIFGTDYKIILEPSNSNNPKIQACNGYVELYSKEIHLLEVMADEKSYNDLDLFKRKVLLHELFHAIFHECGLSEYANDEVLVEFLALQINKIIKLVNIANSM